MGTIKVLKEKNIVGGLGTEEDVYPITSEMAIFDENSNNIGIYNSVINVSTAFPTAGNNQTNQYTLQQAISLIDSKIPNSKKVKGFIVQFIPVNSNTVVSYVYNSDKLFNDTSSWKQLQVIDSLTSLDQLDTFTTPESCGIYQLLNSGEKGGLVIIAQLNSDGEQTGIPIAQFLIGAFYINPDTNILEGKQGYGVNDVVPNIICRKLKNGVWSNWQYYQQTFLSNDGTGNELLTAPTLGYLNSLLGDVNIKTIKTDFSLSALDSYIVYINYGIYKVTDTTGEIVYGYLFAYPTMNRTYMYQVFMGSRLYNSEAGNISNPTIIWRKGSFLDNSWTDWKPLQTLFVSDNGKKPSTELDETMFAPSMRLFNEAIGIQKVVEWSGVIVSDVDISLAALPQEAIYLNPPTAADIFFDDVKKSFCVLYEGIYYVITSLSPDFQETIGDSVLDWSARLKKNYFKGLNNTTWVAVSDTEISPLVDNIYIMPGNIKPFLDKIDRGESPSLSSDEIRALCGGKRFFEAIKTNKLIMSADGVVFTTQSYEARAAGGQAAISYNYPVGSFGLLGLSYAGPEPDSPEAELVYKISMYPEPIKIKDNIYQMPGDITTMENSLDYSIMGPADDLLEAMNSNKLIMSKGHVVQCKYDGNYNLNVIFVEYTELEYIENKYSPVLYKKVWVTNRQFLSLGNYKKYKLTLTEV